MNIFEKYKLYINIKKQKPYYITAGYDKKRYACYVLYSTDDYRIDTICFEEDKNLIGKNVQKYLAYIYVNSNKEFLCLRSLFAKKLFEYGKNYNK